MGRPAPVLGTYGAGPQLKRTWLQLELRDQVRTPCVACERVYDQCVSRPNGNNLRSSRRRRRRVYVPTARPKSYPEAPYSGPHAGQCNGFNLRRPGRTAVADYVTMHVVGCIRTYLSVVSVTRSLLWQRTLVICEYRFGHVRHLH